MDLFAPHGAIKSTLWPASRKKLFILCCYISQSLSYKKYNKMIEIGHFQKLLTLLKPIEWPLDSVDQPYASARISRF